MSRFLKKIEKTDNFLDSALVFTAHAEEKVMQNNALEIYENYFDEDDPATKTDYFSAKTAVSFPDPSRPKCNARRPVSFQSCIMPQGLSTLGFLLYF